MERNQAIALVRETFTARFDESRFTLFVRNLVNHLDESKKQVWTLKKEAFKDYVNHFTRLGTYSDPRGEHVDVLVIHLRKETTLARGRVTLRNFVADYLATGHGQGKAAVIAAFVSPTEEDWRFSFIKLDYTLETTELGIITERAQLTPARRYSYLVGANENCHTAQNQFLELLETDTADPIVATLEAAFSVEKVTKEFYEHYKDLFERSRNALATLLRRTPSIAKEFDERGITGDDFAKKLLGQIVFLYFLQKKGWFGVERGQDWGGGRKDFLRHLFTHRVDYAHVPGGRKREANFFNDILEPLFYEALAYPREADDHYYSRFDCRIPFLNGGLFEPLYGYRWSETDILLPDSLFSEADTVEDESDRAGILDIFDRYNFTVNEAEPLEKEVAVDPEMLGKVFENLLPENIRHASGTYYTPRVIVHYMCQQALLRYLAAGASEIPAKDLAVFLRLAERFTDFEAAKETKAHAGKRLPENIGQNAARLDELLASVTVCDPAIGSGAFPVGMMHEIVRARMALTPSLKKKADVSRTAYELKRHAIHHSLYGVDVDPGAVEIAKLRLWLSMVVDEEEIRDIHPLPNLDYKIMQGNSLLEEFEGTRLFDEKTLKGPDEQRDEQIVDIKEKLRVMQAEAISAHAQGKRGAAAKLSAERDITRLKKTLNTLVHNETHEDIEFDAKESWRRLVRLQKLHEEFFKESNRKKKDEIRAELDDLEWNFMRATLKEQGREHALSELERAIAKHCKPFFLWWLHFSDIKQKRGGFDIVIANPPYVRHEAITSLRGALARACETAASRADLFVFFIERGVRLLRAAGVLCFISSNKYFRAAYGAKLRKYLSEKTTIQRIVDFGDAPVFESIAYASILLASRAKPPPAHEVRALKWPEKESFDDLPNIVEQNSISVPQQALSAEVWNFGASNSGLLERLRSIGSPLKDYVGGRLYYGIKTGLNDAFVIDGETRRRLIEEESNSGDLIKPWLRGRDVKRWVARWHGLYAIVFPFGFHEQLKNYPAILAHLTRFEPKLRKRGQCVSSRGGRKTGQHHWLELDNNPKPSYLHEFTQPKVIIPAIERNCAMAFDAEGYYSNDKTTICVSDDARFVCAVLNSSVTWWIIRQVAAERQNQYYEFKPMYISRLPIPPASDDQRGSIERLVEYLVWLHRSDLAAVELSSNVRGALLEGYFEQWINALVYELFFPEELHAADLHFFDIAQDTGLSPLSDTPGRELSYLRDLFEQLYIPDHRLRRSLFALDSIEEVRVIQGKA
jgi:TaqI-like C-terminal specificity domain/Eco57I restriction-modification methylase